jgi:hypothetical protein
LTKKLQWFEDLIKECKKSFANDYYDSRTLLLDITAMNSRKKNKLTTTSTFCDINPFCSSRYNCYITSMYLTKKNKLTTRNFGDISPFCSSGSLCLKPIVKFLFGGRMETRKDSSENYKCFKADIAILSTVKILHVVPFQQIRLFSFHTSHHPSVG